MFVRLTDAELARLAKFGQPHHYRAGDQVARVGDAGQGLTLILSGQVEVTRREGEQNAPHRHPRARQFHG